jgi:hypothetical protein
VQTSSERGSNDVETDEWGNVLRDNNTPRDDECTNCRQALNLGPEAKPGEISMWCGSCNDEMRRQMTSQDKNGGSRFAIFHVGVSLRCRYEQTTTSPYRLSRATTGQPFLTKVNWHTSV